MLNFRKSSAKVLPSTVAWMSTVERRAVVTFLIGKTASAEEEYNVYPEFPRACWATRVIGIVETRGFLAPIWSTGVASRAVTWLDA